MSADCIRSITQRARHLGSFFALRERKHAKNSSAQKNPIALRFTRCVRGSSRSLRMHFGLSVAHCETLEKLFIVNQQSAYIWPVVLAGIQLVGLLISRCLLSIIIHPVFHPRMRVGKRNRIFIPRLYNSLYCHLCKHFVDTMCV